LSGPSIVNVDDYSGLTTHSGTIGEALQVNGGGFGASQGNSTVTFGGTPATVNNWTANSLYTTVPSGATTGNLVVTVGGLASNGYSFTVTGPSPSITSLSPNSGPVGTSVTITGTNFGDSQGTSTVTFSGTAATPTSWSATSIVAPVPSGAITGNVLVTVSGVASNGVSFTVTGLSSNVYYYIDDMLGSSRTIVKDGQTSACYEADFYPFGGERDVNVSCSQNYKFEGKERDGETQNDNFGARYYSWRFGRWLSADWSTEPTPVPYANLTNPQTLNLYAMVSDNPETFADLNGHDPDDAYGFLAGAEVLAPEATPLIVGAAVGVAIYENRDAIGQAVQSLGNSISNVFHSSDTSKTAPAPQSNPTPGTQTGSQPGQKDSDFVVTPSGTAVATDPGRVRDSLVNAPGVTTTPVNSPSGEKGTIQTGVKTPNGPVDVRTMDGSASHGPRTVITHPGTNSPKTPDGKATNDKNDNHIPNDHPRPQSE
jgi:RHS repeat-associated protein